MKQINGFYINSLPKAPSNRKYTDFDLAKMNAKVFNKKNIHDINVISQLRMWFDDLKQPTEAQVRRAMILLIDEDYALKSGGESASDKIYSSSLKWMQAHPTSGLDYEPVIIKKWSTNFEDVLITFKEIEELWNLTITPKEKEETDIDNIIGCLGMLVGNCRVNKHDMKGRETDWILTYLQRYNEKDILKQLDIIHDRRKADCDNFISTGNGILGNDLNTVCPIKTQNHIDDMQNNILSCETVRTLLTSKGTSCYATVVPRKVKK
jgi:hypothetical protein